MIGDLDARIAYRNLNSGFWHPCFANTGVGFRVLDHMHVRDRLRKQLQVIV